MRVNVCIMLCIFLLAFIQLHEWKRSFSNKWNSDIQTHYDQMKSSFFLNQIIFVGTGYAILISIIGLRNLMKIWQKLRWMDILVPLAITTCLSAIVVVFICPSKSAEILVQNIFKVSVFHLSYSIIFCS